MKRLGFRNAFVSTVAESWCEIKCSKTDESLMYYAICVCPAWACVHFCESSGRMLKIQIFSATTVSSRMVIKQRFWLVCKVQFWLGIAFAVAKPHEGLVRQRSYDTYFVISTSD